ncbi:hypothetical protein [Type-D symbiont of Plautia stali]|uniref:hypothetical protein n=1 Tax=Type-D symbiont of Plautia stali TaxID=1560356 RepID=UPI00092F7682|nr:hypothetical protein [Type-D symbiont of Plautia stali]
MKKLLTAFSLTTFLLMLSGCGNNTLNEFGIGNLNSLLNPESQKPVSKNAELTQRDSVNWTSATLSVPVDTAAVRLKLHYGFVSDTDVTAARNSGQGNAGWSASAISEGTSWDAQSGSYYRMSRNWAVDDRLTLEVRGNSKESFIKSTYTSSNPEHLKKTWTSRLWKQIPDVASGSLE